MRFIRLALVAALLAGCGTGGGGAAGSAVQATQALVEFSTESGSVGTVLYAVDFTLHLPSGVTLAADSTSGEVAAAALQPADSSALAGARFQPASAGAPASVRVNIVDPGGFGVGPLAVLSCSVAPGSTVASAGFSLEGFSAKDASGAIIPGITPRFTVRTQ